MTDNIGILEYDPNETITQYLRRAEQFKAKLQNVGYNLVLNFLNDLLGLEGKFKMSSITEFKRIDVDDVG